MTKSNELLETVYSVSNRGLDIITGVCPAAAEVINTPKRKFRLRSDERTPSAQLYAPRDAGDCWHVKDYGMAEGGGWFSPIDLYMWSMGYSRSHFAVAVQELAERYGVQEQLTRSQNRPLVERRATLPAERGQQPVLDLFSGCGTLDLAVWGPAVQAEHLEALGWHGVRSLTTYGDEQTVTITSTDAYPIYAQRCTYADGEGREQLFWKVYEPRNPDKAFRFRFVGQKPRDYIYGLDALRRAFRRNDEQRLREVLLVSGGSDAVNALSMGYQPVWLDSETRLLRPEELKELLRYAERVVNVPDIDDTGMRMGQRLALALPTLYTAWLTPKDFGQLHDNRGRRCKDLKDYVSLHRDRQAMQQLVGRARRAQFWHENRNSKGRTDYTISQTALSYFLWLNGYCTLKDDTQRDPRYIHIEGIKVRPIMAKTIISFLNQWCDSNGVDERLQNTLLKQSNLPSNTCSTLTERDDLDFTQATANSQRFYFRNGWIEVTADAVRQHPYTDSGDGHYVWVDAVVAHDFTPMPRMFSVSREETGRYSVKVNDDAPSKLLRFVRNTSRLHWRKTDEQHLPLTPEEQAEEEQCLLSRLCNIGYNVFTYKSASEAWATLCLDYAMTADGECNGRSGKSFLVNAMAQLTNTFPIDGRTLARKNNQQFLFDGVTTATNLIAVDECPRGFDFNYFYGMITGDLRVEKKGHDSHVIPFSESPKWLFATNFTLGEHSASTEGRIWPQVFSDYYHVKTKLNDYRETRTIRDDFGQNLMDEDYSATDWQADLNFMVQCVQVYMSLPKGERRQLPPLRRIEQREQLAAVGRDFGPWADDYFAIGSGHLDCYIKADAVVNDFNQETRLGWSLRTITQYVKDYCLLAPHIKCFNPGSVLGKPKDGERCVKRDEMGNRKVYYYIQSTAQTEKDHQSQQQALMNLDEPF